MKTSFHIAVFARAPVAGSVKTRLIPLLGEEGAAAAQREMTSRALATACSVAPGQVSLWTAGRNTHPFFLDCATRFDLTEESAPPMPQLACHPQCAGDLGMRMADCLRTQLMRHETVLLIGTDCPVLSATDLHAAAQALQQGAKMVFTPAEDGGYVLVGAHDHGISGNTEAGFLQAFQAIDWGTSRVMAQTRARLTAIGWQAGRDWHELPILWDVDTPFDYARAQKCGLLRS